MKGLQAKKQKKGKIIVQQGTYLKHLSYFCKKVNHKGNVYTLSTTYLIT